MHTRKCEACTESDNCEELHLECVDRGERGRIIECPDVNTEEVQKGNDITSTSAVNRNNTASHNDDQKG
jgi:hypothetical protein